MDAEPLVQGEPGLHLLLVVEGVAAGLMVTDDLDALRAGIGGDPFEVEVRVGFGEAVVRAIAEPVAVPTCVPAFDQHAAETVGGGEIDMAQGVLGRCPVVGTR